MTEKKEENKKIEIEKTDKIIWTDEQNEIVGKMINESEAIGWTQGYDEAVKELIQELELKVRELKSKIYIGEKKNE